MKIAPIVIAASFVCSSAWADEKSYIQFKIEYFDVTSNTSRPTKKEAAQDANMALDSAVRTLCTTNTPSFKPVPGYGGTLECGKTLTGITCGYVDASVTCRAEL